MRPVTNSPEVMPSPLWASWNQLRSVTDTRVCPGLALQNTVPSGRAAKRPNPGVPPIKPLANTQAAPPATADEADRAFVLAQQARFAAALAAVRAVDGALRRVQVPAGTGFQSAPE